MSSTVDGKTHIFTQQQSCPALLEMNVGQSLELSLQENPSTAYRWSVAEASKLFKVEQFDLNDAKQSLEESRVGAGTTQMFKFTAEHAGEELLHVKHARSWESAAIEEWKCRVRVSS